MGNLYSQEDYNRSASEFYQIALRNPCLLPDVSIDESLLRYSGLDSNAALQTYSNELLDAVPGYIEKLGSGLGALTLIPNAVGLGALVISMIIEICSKGASQTTDQTFSMLRRVFGEEKASAVRDTMTEYLRRHQTSINNNQRLREEIHRLEQQLSKDLTVLRNSLLHDGQMSTRGFKIWVNGASFHLQMLIHQARLNPQADSVNRIRSTIGLYLQDLNHLLEKYTTLQSSVRIRDTATCFMEACDYDCYIESDKCRVDRHNERDPCSGSEVNEAFMKLVFSDIRSALDNHFINIRTNLNDLINQHSSFTLPNTT